MHITNSTNTMYVCMYACMYVCIYNNNNNNNNNFIKPPEEISIIHILQCHSILSYI